MLYMIIIMYLMQFYIFQKKIIQAHKSYKKKLISIQVDPKFNQKENQDHKKDMWPECLVPGEAWTACVCSTQLDLVLWKRFRMPQ